MKILVIASTIDLRYRFGCTPAWWQLLKAFKETGNDVIVIPYLGRSIETPWWRAYGNPCYYESIAYNAYLERKKSKGEVPNRRGTFSYITDGIVNSHIKPKWEKHVRGILEAEKDIGFVLFMNVPLDHIDRLVREIKAEYGIPVAYYEGDMPTILPKYTVDRGFRFNYYARADLRDYDAFFTNSKGVIDDLKELGAGNVVPLYFAADPEIFKPVDVVQDIDVFFYGYGNEFREEWMTKMITVPSARIPTTSFLIAGSGFTIDLGQSKIIRNVSSAALSSYCCRSKINLNITRWSHAGVYASATTRLFELAALGVCIVSQPYKGIEEWFEPKKEIIIVNDENEAVETYKWLLSSDEMRFRIGRKARERVLTDHTYQSRSKLLVDTMKRAGAS